MPRRPLDHDIIAAIQQDIARYEFYLNAAQINRICADAGIMRLMRRGFDTTERELFCDALARKFAGTIWPTNSRSFTEQVCREFGLPYYSDEEFMDRLVKGYVAYKRTSPLTSNDDPLFAKKPKVSR